MGKKIFIMIFAICTLIGEFLIGNILCRKSVYLTEQQTAQMNVIYPKTLFNEVKIYTGGLMSLGSTRVMCRSIYLTKADLEEYQSGTLSGKATLVHELLHAYENETLTDCLASSADSLSQQLYAWIKYKNRNYAYAYYLNAQGNYKYTAEQRAMLVQDYYRKVINLAPPTRMCKNCRGINAIADQNNLYRNTLKTLYPGLSIK